MCRREREKRKKVEGRGLFIAVTVGCMGGS